MPRAGLTVVVGRNGSGKSSFAEAVELSLTGDSSRWADKNSVWRTGWRNLHVPDPCAISTELRADGSVTPVRITRAWAAGAALIEADVTVSSSTGTSTSLDGLGLSRDLDLYRPFLTATDLGKLLAGSNTELFDAIDAILGLDLLTTADKRLMTAARPRDAGIKQVREDRQALRARLEGHADPRARRAATLLATTRPDLDQLDALLSEPHPSDPDGNVAVVRALAELTVPDPAQVEQLAGDLDAAAQDNQRHDQMNAGATIRVAELLRLALDHHDDAGDGPCPVCRTGVLDAAWRSDASASLEQLRVSTVNARRAASRLADLEHRARAVATGLTIPTATCPVPLWLSCAARSTRSPTFLPSRGSCPRT